MPVDASVVIQIRQVLSRVRSEAIGKASKMKLFTQTPAGDSYNIMDSNGVAGGVCCALALFWLNSRSNRQDFLDTLLGPGGTIRTDALMPAINLQREIADPDTQMVQAKAWLARHNLNGALKTKETIKGLDLDIGNWFCQNPMINPYRLLAIRGGYDHAMALDLSRPNDLVFFDPNLGSFHFNSMTRLIDFLNTTIYPATGSGTTLTRNSEYIGRKRFILIEMGCFS